MHILAFISLLIHLIMSVKDGVRNVFVRMQRLYMRPLEHPALHGERNLVLFLLDRPGSEACC